jgi:hypothetical protein
VLFLDIKKAFDRVDHVILLDRLHHIGIRGKAWLWIRSFLTDRRMRTVDESLCSNWLPIRYGVPQGCVLSPLLFLIFIDDALRAIEADTLRCGWISPAFFADDGAVLPRPLVKRPPKELRTTAAINKHYHDQLGAAVAHLDAWAKDSRMDFGEDKTAIVAFHALRQNPDHAHLASLYNYTVCGFRIQISPSYTYLGVDLAGRHLSWTPHTQRALTACRAAAARVMRVALRAPEPSAPAIRALVLGYVIPSCMYGAMWWARKLSETDDRRFQQHFVGPLRAALHLPRTSHQLGTAVMCGIPSVRAIVAMDELRFAHRLQRLEVQEPHHPTVELAHHCEQAVANVMPQSALLPLYSFYASSYTLTTTIPDLLDPGAAGITKHLSDQHIATLNLQPPPSPRYDANLWSLSGDPQIAACRKLTTQQYTPIRNWSRRVAARLRPSIISAVGRWLTLRQWQVQHDNNALPPPAARPPHNTAAPLTACQTVPGPAFFLARGGDSSYRHVVRRARLLCDRAYTQLTRTRFAKAGDPTQPHCTHPPCKPANGPPPLESLQHTLILCGRYDAARQTLKAALQPLGHGLSQLSLSSILCAMAPPKLGPDGRALLLKYTNAFLDAIDATRKATLGLQPLDAG